jgi:aryl-alcohol dehydrogenase-like predicted oxidoreductase
VEQPQYNLLERAGFEQDVRPAALRNGMGIVTWSPLASGMLSGKYDQGMPEGARLSRLDELRNHVLTGENRSRIVKFKEIADDVGCTRSQLALAWTAAQKGVSSVILGVTRLEQLLENLGALGVVITPEIRRRIGVLFPPAGLYKNARLWARRVVKGE